MTRPHHSAHDADRLIVGELIEQVSSTSPDRFHGAILDWLAAGVGCDSSLFMPAPDRKMRPVERNKGSFVQRFLQGSGRYRASLEKGIAAVKRDGMFIDCDVYSQDERRELPFYAEVIRPQRISSQLVIGLSFQQRYRGTFYVCRHGHASRFHSSLIRRMRAILPALGLIDAAAVSTAAAPSIAREDLGLGAREREVADLAGRGLETKEIAALLGTRPATVRNQLHAIFRKLDVSNRTELAFVLAGASSDNARSTVSGAAD